MLFIFSTPVLIRHLWQLKTVVLHYDSPLKTHKKVNNTFTAKKDCLLYISKYNNFAL